MSNARCRWCEEPMDAASLLYGDGDLCTTCLLRERRTPDAPF